MPDYHLRQQEIQRTLSIIVDELEKNEEQFWQLIEAIPNVVVISDKSGTITYVNRRVINMFGYQPDELVGQSVDILLPDHLSRGHYIHRQSYFKNPTNRAMGQDMELIAKRKDHSEFPVEIGLGYLPSSEEEEAIAFIIDITARKRNQDAISEKEQMLKKSQAMAHIGSWEVNLRTSETVWSDEFFRICGLEPQSIEPSTQYGLTLIHPEDREQAAKAFEETRKTNIPYEIEKRIIRPNGEVRWVISQGEITLNEMTGDKHLSGVFIDITERKRLQEQQFKMRLDHERLQMLSQFIQGFSHEFRTPLSSINSSAYVMAHTEKSDIRMKKLATIEQQVQRSTQLLDMLLTTVVLETVTALEVMPINLVNVIEAVCHATMTQYTSVDLTFYQTDFNPTIMAHSVYLYDALSQIVSNACRYIQDGGTVILILKQIDDTALFICKDTGIGIAEEHLPHIFSPFWREDEAHSTPGFGLGLTLAKKVIEMHHGTISVTSELGKGTSVSVTLPLATVK